MMDDREIAAVVLAHANGAKIQSRILDPKREHVWVNVNRPSWDFTYWEFRVRPQPKEWLIADGRAYPIAEGDWPPLGGIRVREVIE